MQNGKNRPFFFFGAVSLLVVLIILVLSSFAVLSLLTASNEHKLSEKSAAAVKEYYRADAQAEEKAFWIAQTFGREGWREAFAEKGVSFAEEGGQVRVEYTVAIQGRKELHVALRLTERETVRLLWQVQLKEE